VGRETKKREGVRGKEREGEGEGEGEREGEGEGDGEGEGEREGEGEGERNLTRHHVAHLLDGLVIVFANKSIAIIFLPS